MNKREIYVYPAIFHYEDDGISISFPDLPGCYSCAWSDEEGLRMAKEALGLHLWSMEDDGDIIPRPSSLMDVSLEENERAVLVEVYMPLIRASQDARSVKKTLTIPAWMDKIAKEEHINFSLLLQNAILDTLKRRPQA